MKVESVFLRTEFNYDRDAASDATGTFNDEPSMTKQSFAEEADINTIVRRFGLTGQLPNDVRVPMNGDFTEVTNFHEAMQLVVEAREAFMEMPADVRARFGNDPGAFVDFASNPDNKEEARRLGLLVPEAVIEPATKPVVAPATVPSTPTT